jgi:hypothetical protein
VGENTNPKDQLYSIIILLQASNATAQTITTDLSNCNNLLMNLQQIRYG